MKETCSQCEKDFICSVETANQCWCTKYPPILSLSDTDTCLCPSCMKAAIKIATEKYAAAVKEGTRINEAPTYAHAGQAAEEGIDYNIENGLLVMSSWYHLKRGTCCGSGCRNCPYGGSD